MNPWEPLVEEFGRLIGAEGLEIATAGACRLELDARLDIDFELDAQGSLHLYCELPPVMADDRPAVALALLAKNYVNQRQHIAAEFSWDQATSTFLLHSKVAPDATSLEAFEAAVRQFTQVAEEWVQRLESDTWDAAATPMEASLSPLLMQRA